MCGFMFLSPKEGGINIISSGIGFWGVTVIGKDENLDDWMDGRLERTHPSNRPIKSDDFVLRHVPFRNSFTSRR